jgi:hypothetical protein
MGTNQQSPARGFQNHEQPSSSFQKNFWKTFECYHFQMLELGDISKKTTQISYHQQSTVWLAWNLTQSPVLG